MTEYIGLFSQYHFLQLQSMGISPAEYLKDGKRFIVTCVLCCDYDLEHYLLDYPDAEVLDNFSLSQCVKHVGLPWEKTDDKGTSPDNL